MTSPARSPEQDDEETRPGPGLRWDGDGGLARQRAPLWGGGSLDATASDSTIEATPLRAVSPSMDLEALPLASAVRRFSAWIMDYMLRLVIYLTVLAFAGIESTQETWLDPTILLPFLFLSAGYNFIFGIQGKTPAGYLMRVRIASADGSPPGVWRSLVRAVTSAHETVLIIGTLWVFFGRRRQTLQDRIAGTIVVEEPRAARRG